MTFTSCFAPSYVEARDKFLQAAAAIDAPVASYVLDGHTGLHGEVLATDVVRLGNPGARTLLITTSATHGVEGFCGSAAQIALLHDRALHALLKKTDVAILVVHAINPYGFSHLSRTNEENIDLNRNSVDFSRPLPVNTAYDELHALLVPQEWPPSAENARAISDYIERNGQAAYQQALTTGQYHHADGMFYGGARTSWSTQLLQTLLSQHATDARHVGWIDFHTGLGPYGHGEKICVGNINEAELARARAWWGADLASPLDGTTVASNVAGPVLDTLRRFPCAARTTAIAIEYGTVPLIDMLHMLRADAWLRQHPQAPRETRDAIRGDIRAAFYCEDDAWRGMILGQARTAILQGILGLSREPGIVSGDVAR